MPTTTSLSEQDVAVLRVVVQGHPDRKLTKSGRNINTHVSALTVSEIQVALGLSENTIINCIAHLVSVDLIASGRELPSLWGRLTGRPEQWYVWATEQGKCWLDDVKSAANRPENSRLENFKDELSNIAELLDFLGFTIAPDGVGLALTGLFSGYKPAEMASYIILCTLALDVKEAEDRLDVLMNIFSHGITVIEALRTLRDKGHIRNDIYDNDTNAIIGVIKIESEQLNWVERVLSDPLLKNNGSHSHVMRIASSNLYSKT